MAACWSRKNGEENAIFGDVADPGVWSQVHDEGVQALENIANIRVPVIAAIEGRAHVHSDYALLASVIVAEKKDSINCRRLVLTIVGLLVVTGFALTGYGQTNEASPEPGSLRWWASQARAKGESSITIVVSNSLNGDADSFETALDYYTVVIAKPLTSVDQVGTSSIETWYKFQIEETLSVPRKCEPCDPMPAPPAVLLPLARNQVVVPVVGGSAEIDGVKVIVKTRRPLHFSLDQPYLLLLSTGTGATNVALIGAGAAGVYTIDPEGKIQSSSSTNPRLKQEILSHGNLFHVREHIQAHASATNGSPAAKPE